MQVQFDTYMEQLDEYTTDTVEKLYMHMINNCERMPSLFEIKRVVRDHGWGVKRIIADFELTCLKCDNTGFIPFINRPKGITLRYYLTTYRCDCSYGREMSESIPQKCGNGFQTIHHQGDQGALIHWKTRPNREGVEPGREILDKINANGLESVSP